MTSDADRTVPRRTDTVLLAPVPTRWTIFLRTFIPWQMVRFAAINLRMFRLIWRSHGLG
jgi:hypothetical protein